jgi:hypothetical protein
MPMKTNYAITDGIQAMLFSVSLTAWRGGDGGESERELYCRTTPTDGTGNAGTAALNT